MDDEPRPQVAWAVRAFYLISTAIVRQPLALCTFHQLTTFPPGTRALPNPRPPSPLPNLRLACHPNVNINTQATSRIYSTIRPPTRHFIQHPSPAQLLHTLLHRLHRVIAILGLAMELVEGRGYRAGCVGVDAAAGCTQVMRVVDVY
jgi:hypothetical protein